MNLKKYYSVLLKRVKEREDLVVEKHQLAYHKKNFAFYRIRSKYIGANDKVLLITAGFHGDEIAGPITIQKRLREIIEYAHRRDIKLIIYPLVNPSGFLFGTRYNIDGEGMNNDFVRYETMTGELKDDILDNEEFKRWYWSSDNRLDLCLPVETKLLHKLLKKDPLKNITAFLDLHQDGITPNLGIAAYHYSYGDLSIYSNIVSQIKNIVPIPAGLSTDAGQASLSKIDKDGFIVRHDGTSCDLFFRLGKKYSITAETGKETPLSKAIKVNLLWIYGLIDLVKAENAKNETDVSARVLILPKRIDVESRVHLVHTSSPVLSSQQKKLQAAITKFQAKFSRLKVFNVEKTELDPRHLSASEKERLTKFRRASKKVDWLQPIFGGTGAVDIVRHFSENDLKLIKKSRPVINGFSDTTTIINYFYLKLKLLTFHYSNFQGLFDNENGKDFFKLVQGEIENLIYQDKEYRWLGEKPEEKIEGIAIGGNLSTFRDLIEVCRIKVRSWKPFIFFVEDVELDTEDLHRVIIALDQKGIFQKVRAIVLGSIDDVTVSRDYKKFNFMFGRSSTQDNPDDVFNYLLAKEIERRKEEGDPLYILKVNNLGHGVTKNNMIIPIGAKTIISRSGKIEFKGPFVK